MILFKTVCIISPLQATGRNVPLIHLLILVLYILFACLLGFPHLLPFFFTYFFLSTSLLTFFFENRPSLFLGRMSLKATKSGLKLFQFNLSYSIFVFLVHP